MKILIVDNGRIPVSLYGGTERVIWYLGKELNKLGHQVTYLVKKGSYCDFAKVIEIDENKEITQQIPSHIDIIHFNFIPNKIETLRLPYLITVHGNTNHAEPLNKNCVFVSQNHANRYGSDSYVYNGLDWSDYTPPDWARQRTYFHFLGNAAWQVKNLVGAIKVIHQTPQERLHVLGGVRFNFNMGIRLTFSHRVRFHGMVGGKVKDILLNGSKGLLFPVRWHEPFGLAIIESLYYGCPIFATPYGSLPELVNSEVGYLSNNSTDLAAALLGHSFSPQRCHQYALENFSSQKMAKAYLEKYAKVLANQTLNATVPCLQTQSDDKFLAWH
jgi:glycosyltransferase involved in cell wall biosynthesis